MVSQGREHRTRFVCDEPPFLSHLCNSLTTPNHEISIYTTLSVAHGDWCVFLGSNSPSNFFVLYVDRCGYPSLLARLLSTFGSLENLHLHVVKRASLSLPFEFSLPNTRIISPQHIMFINPFRSRPRSQSPNAMANLLKKQATVVEDIFPAKRGQIYWQGSYYRAYCLVPGLTLKEDDLVVVESFDAKILTAFVRPSDRASH